MTGRVLGIVVLTTIAVSTLGSRALAVAPGQPTPIMVGDGPLGGSIIYKLSGSTPGSSTPTKAPPTAPPSTAATNPPPTTHVQPMVETPSPPTTVGVFSTCEAGISTYTNSAGQLQTQTGGGLFSCPPPPTAVPSTASPTGKSQPTVPPSEVAAAVWAEDGANQLPSPHPHIAPGYALAGLPGYLEVGAPLNSTFTDDTRLGALTIQATAEVWVNWGDGDSNDGPYHTVGGPWPNGTITHYWDDDGTYDVVVDEDWTATWSLAGQSGTLTGLQTEGSIPDFKVGQVESVRNY